MSASSEIRHAPPSSLQPAGRAPSLFADTLSPIRVLVISVVAVFVAEFAIMIAFLVLPPFPQLVEVFIDSTALALIITPAFYGLIFRPLARQIEQRKQAETEIRTLYLSMEQQVANRTRALTLSAEVSRRISTILDQQQLIAAVAEQIQTTFNYYHVHVYLYDPHSESLAIAGGTGEAARTMLTRGHRIPKGRGLVGRAASTNAPVLVPDVSTDSGWLPNPLLPDTKAEVAVPIAVGGTVLGVLDVQHNLVNSLTQDDAQILHALGNQLAVALQNARTYERAQRQADMEAMVNDLGQKIQKAATVDDVLQIAARELGQALRAQRASVELGIPGQQPRN